MKPGACLINTARCPMVNEEALREALLSGRLLAALDVLAEEPFRKNHPLLGMDDTPLCLVFGDLHGKAAGLRGGRGSASPAPSRETHVTGSM